MSDVRTVLLFVVLLTLAACDQYHMIDIDSDGIPGLAASDTEDPPVEPFYQSAGFIHLPPRQISLLDPWSYGGNRLSGVTDEANIFYALVPADTRPEEMPLMVIFNGGPGGATTGYLFAYGTAPFFIDASDSNNPIKENPNSFSAIANLLYIDTRQAGFSYELAPTPEMAAQKDGMENFIDDNSYTDASDMLLTVIGVMERVPALANNPVVLMGESYGGARITHIYSLLSRPADLFDPDAPSLYDPALGEALKRHFGALMPELSFDSVGLADVARQFGWQIMLQPGAILPNVNHMECMCDGMPEDDPRYDLCMSSHDMFDLRYPVEAPDEKGLAAGNLFLLPTLFEQLFNVPPESIPGMPAADRRRAFRHCRGSGRVAEPSHEWTSRLGGLGGNDCYYVPLIFAFDAFAGGAVSRLMPFMQSLAHINTFISNAFHDPVVCSGKIPGALVDANSLFRTPLVASATLDPASPSDAERPGEMRVSFTDAMGLPLDTAVTVRMPTYYDSGHMIPLHQAGDLREDIRAFLEERGAYP